MPPTLIACHCDPSWPAMAVCDTCAERARLHRLLVERGAVRAVSAHPSGEAYAALLTKEGAE